MSFPRKGKRGAVDGSFHPAYVTVPAILTAILMLAYLLVLQKMFSDEILESGVMRNSERADSVYTMLNEWFSSDDFAGITSPEDMELPRYTEIQNRLNELRRIKGMRYLYTAGRSDDGTIVYLIDGLDRSADDFAVPGTPLEAEMIPFIESALGGDTVYSQDIVDTTWGHIFTACYPVTANDGNGSVVGALCIEMDMESIYDSISAGKRRQLFLTLAAATLVVVLTVPVHVLRQKHKIAEDKRRIELQDSLKRVQEREMLLEALCIDYDSVYFCDLVSDTTVIIKEDSSSYDPMAYEVLGDKADSFSFRTSNYFKYFVEPDSAPGLAERLSNENLIKYLSEHSHMTGRFRVKPNPTGHRYVEVKAVPVRAEEGFKIVMGFHFIDDIVEEQEHQKSQLEKALKEAQKNNEIISAVAKIYQMIYYIDLENSTYEAIASGEAPDENVPPSGKITGLMDPTLEKFVAPEWRGEMRTFLDVSTLSGRLSAMDSVTAEFQDNGGRWYRARYIIKNKDADGRATGVLYVSRDITFEKQQELELKQSLKETAEEAERANASKTDFLRRMSHDVRTPINGIRGMVEIANYYPNDLQKQKECRDKILASTSHLLSLVNNILDMNKLESGRIVMRREPFDLVKLISETDSIAEMQAIEHNIRYNSCDCSGIIHRYLTGSETHLKQILLNFSSNAVKYNREGGSVTVNCREISSNDGSAVFQFTCEDTGIGMSEEFQKRAFEPFSQEEKSGSSHYAGSGLGLSIAKQLVELMGGTIELHSEENVGTSVSFTLKFDIDSGHSHDSSEDIPAGFSMSGVKVLLAEDNDLNAEIAEFLFEKYGISVTRAENGRQAVDMFEAASAGEYDAVFMDVMMPVMGGLEAARAIRSLNRPDAAVIPIFAMTANAFVDDIQRSYDAGMNEHLTKPLQESEIIRTLNRYVKK